MRGKKINSWNSISTPLPSQFSRSVVSDSLRPHGLQHARLPCPSPTPGGHPNPCPLGRWCHSTISSSVVPFSSCPQIFPSFRIFSNESALRLRWPKFWSFSFTISPSNEQPRLISFRIDWLDLLDIQGTLKSLLQHHSSKASILWHSAFFTVQLSHPYMTTGKTIALTSWTFVGKVMSLLFNMLSRLVITCLPRSKRLDFMVAVTICSDFGAPQNKSATVSTVSPSISHEVMGPDVMILVFWMFKLTFSLLSFTIIKRLIVFAFCHKGGVICISEVVDISPGNLNSSLCFFQPSVSHDVLCIEVK